MIVFYHDKYKITEIGSTITDDFSIYINRNITAILLDFAEKFEDEVLVWCHQSEKGNLNLDAIPKLFHHKKMLLSFNPSEDYFGRLLGYIEDTTFVKVNKEVKYGTWQMSSHVGAVHASVLNACRKDLKAEGNFDYFLNSFAKRALPCGLFCYSEPGLLVKKSSNETPKSSLAELFKFSKQHYRSRWVFMLFLNLAVFEKKLPLLPFLFSFFYSKRKFNLKLLSQVPIESSKIKIGTIDVLIPTIGRKEYLHDVLNNLAAQSYLPKNVIVIEQNPDENSSSELDFIQNQSWPFKIKHHFTHQTGACNARNIGLAMIESDFAFLADDDIVFEQDLLENAMQIFTSIGNEAFMIAVHLESQEIISEPPRQFAVFGAGHAFVKSACISGLKFKIAYEFGFGEDNDFGMQLRNKGVDILYTSTSKILHLKAPIGGFRTKPALRWQHDAITPKPSPTLMLYRLLHDTNEQLRNYKWTIFFKNINKKFFLNPFKYTKDLKQQWNRSVYWANELKKNK